MSLLIEPRPVKLTTRTGVEVRRTLPHANLKMIGAWCFVDHFGPTEQTDGMVVAAHPHTGLQTVTWLIEGAIEHRDSIGSVQVIQPGQLNLMTAGSGIAHSELSQTGPERLHAVQLWVALPAHAIDTAPEFEHQDNLPKLALVSPVGEPIGYATVLAGEFMGNKAATKTFSPLMGAEIRIKPGKRAMLPLNHEFEHGIMAAQGAPVINGQALMTSGLIYFEPGTEYVSIEAGEEEIIVLLLGGKPFGEKILMWWNFIGRTHEEISRARTDWNSREEVPGGGRFGEFTDHIGGWIPAPDLPNVTLQPR
jgi:redox-sensitive bicupin YhaK (pirin superfamily)